MKHIKTEFGEYYLFDSPLNQWSGHETYVLQMEQLYKQINQLLSLNGGLAQSSQGYEEDWDHHKKLQDEAKMLGQSIKEALLIE